MITPHTVNEYLRPEFLYFVAFQRQSILIYPFEYLKHLEPLKDLLSQWYVVKQIDGAALNRVENVEVFLAQSSELIPYEIPGIFVIENMTQSLITLFSKYPLSPFLGITKDTRLNPVDGSVILYNKKSN